jgi:excinuclease ABC subunit B
MEYLSKDKIELMIENTEQKMRKAAKELDFISAAQYRDELFALKKRLKDAV